MTTPISNATQAPAAHQVSAKPSDVKPKEASSPTQPAAQTTATISSAGRAAAAQEAAETPAQTAREAGAGDHQAQALVSKHAHHGRHASQGGPAKASAKT